MVSWLVSWLVGWLVGWVDRRPDMGYNQVCLTSEEKTGIWWLSLVGSDERNPG